MKQITTNSLSILFIEVPENAKEVAIGYNDNGSLFYLSNKKSESVELPFGLWKILGKSTELSEEQMKEICQSIEIDDYTYDERVFYDMYRNYSLDESYWNLKCDQCSNVQESYLSLLEANGIVDRNLIERPEIEKYILTGKNKAELDMLEEDSLGLKPSWKSIFLSNYEDKLNQYQEAQSKVEHYLVLKKS